MTGRGASSLCATDASISAPLPLAKLCGSGQRDSSAIGGLRCGKHSHSHEHKSRTLLGSPPSQLRWRYTHTDGWTSSYSQFLPCWNCFNKCLSRAYTGAPAVHRMACMAVQYHQICHASILYVCTNEPCMHLRCVHIRTVYVVVGGTSQLRVRVPRVLFYQLPAASNS